MLFTFSTEKGEVKKDRGRDLGWCPACFCKFLTNAAGQDSFNMHRAGNKIMEYKYLKNRNLAGENEMMNFIWQRFRRDEEPQVTVAL